DLGPAEWGRIVCTAYARYDANVVVYETNFGGAMCKLVIESAAKELGVKINCKPVTASRGKVIRAEPISALYEHKDGLVRHVGMFPKLEDELAGFTMNGFVGTRSPNRADAAIWALTEIFSGIVNPRKPPQQKRDDL